MLTSLIASLSAYGATLTVDPEGGGYTTISAAVAAASTGDTVEVAPGTYAEAINFLGKAITIESLAGAEATVIEGNGIVTLNASSSEPSGATLVGFTLRGEGHTCALISGASLQIRDSTFETCGGSTTFIGGAAQISGGAPSFENVTFRGNSAVNGGAIRAAFGADIAINGCTFEDNAAEAGGAMHLTDAVVSITESSFLGNRATNGRGGAIWANEVELTASTTSFSGNRAVISGGALFLSESSVTLGNLTTVTENEAMYGSGGFARVDGAESFTLSNTTVESNQAWMLGGAMSITESAGVEIDGVIFENNHHRSTEGGGGAFSARDTAVTFTDCSFNSNVTEGRGGAIVTIDSSLNIGHSSFDSNSSSGQAGAWFAAGGTATCIECTFERNRSTDDGGAIWSSSATAEFSNCDFRWNEASGGAGGAIYFAGTDATISSSFLARNSALDGGALFSGESSTIETTFSVFQENEATFSGGAIAAGGSPTAEVRLINNDFLANECVSGDGVAQVAVDSAAVDIRNNIIAFGRVGSGVGLSTSPGVTVFAYNDVYSNEGGNYAETADLTGIDGNQSTDPRLVELSIDRNFLNDNLYLRIDSPLVEAGDPTIEVADGRRSYIGAFDRIDFEDSDADGDGYSALLDGDCDDGDASVYPGAPELCDDGIDNDCDESVDEECPGPDTGDSGMVDPGSADTGSADTGLRDTGGPAEDGSAADDDRTPPTDTPQGDDDTGIYKVSGEGCGCATNTQVAPRTLWWLLVPAFVLVRRK